jgi:2,3-bisphosphoglycerate-dependent phosphoglycerate mutase
VAGTTAGKGSVTVRLLLIRHGRPDFTSREFTQTPRGRQWDPSLDEKGLEQADALASRLLIMDRPVALAVSPLRRCRQTIEPYLLSAGLDAQVTPDLGEVYVGNWEGMGFEEIVSGDEELARRFREQEAMFSLAPGGEGGPALRRRVIPAIEQTLDGVNDGVVVAVTHGGVINAYLGHIMGIPHDMFFLPDHTSINTIRVEGDRREMVFLNDIRHLTDPSIFAPPAGSEAHRRDEGDSAD